MNLTGRRAIVLGGTSGIGLAAVLQLQEAGAQVVACGRREENLAKTNSQTGDAVTCERVDVLDREGLSALFARFAPVDVLVCAATGGDRATGPFAQMDLDGFQGSFRKLWGYTNSVRLALEHLAEDASIVLVSGSPRSQVSARHVGHLDGRQRGRGFCPCRRARDCTQTNQRGLARSYRYADVSSAGRGA